MESSKGLMIGNYVKCAISNDAAFYKITQMSYAQVVLNGVRDKEIITIEKIKPIPITESIMLKCGFVKIYTNIDIWDLRIGNFYLHGNELKVGNPNWIEPEDRTLTYVYNLHSLQNLVFSLTGRELEVSL